VGGGGLDGVGHLGPGPYRRLAGVAGPLDRAHQVAEPTGQPAQRRSLVEPALGQRVDQIRVGEVRAGAAGVRVDGGHTSSLLPHPLPTACHGVFSVTGPSFTPRFGGVLGDPGVPRALVSESNIFITVSSVSPKLIDAIPIALAIFGRTPEVVSSDVPNSCRRLVLIRLAKSCASAADVPTQPSFRPSQMWKMFSSDVPI